MERLSCSPGYMWIKKKAAPSLCALIAIGASGIVLWHIPTTAALHSKSPAELLTLLVLFVAPLVIAAFAISFVLSKANSIMDEVCLDGDTLILSNRRRIERIPLVDVLDASAKPSMYDDLDRTIVLTLRGSRFGRTVMFSVPRKGYLPSDAAQAFIQRISASKNTTS
ncbi:MAG TPA: hypothetical protein VF264_00825 [Rhodanobacteraceae bacterium]